MSLLEETQEYVPNTPPFPLQTRQIATTINNNHTEIVITPFSDHIFIIITQTQKIGTMFQAFKVSGDMTISGEPNYTISTLIGKRDDPVLTTYARQLIELVGNTSSKPILLGIALLDESKETFRTIMDIIEKNKMW
eukprot:Phypoly_transcript_27432.p1 GENE.Phypoly_transcript_27432~~Phypoly_transcript_27432.p1  ORF type:complete len:136 (-),score=21.49 Phypoly_transcript_27432:3-410(-)